MLGKEKSRTEEFHINSIWQGQCREIHTARGCRLVTQSLLQSDMLDICLSSYVLGSSQQRLR